MPWRGRRGGRGQPPPQALCEEVAWGGVMSQGRGRGGEGAGSACCMPAMSTVVGGVSWGAAARLAPQLCRLLDV